MPRQLHSTVHDDRTVRLTIDDVEAPEPGDHEVLVEVQAAPINPSDLGPMLRGADATTARPDGDALVLDLPDAAWALARDQVGTVVPVGNEGAGEVVAAGSSVDEGLVGRLASVVGGGTYADQAATGVYLPLPDGATAAEGASSFVNPVTTLGMLDTLRDEGHAAMVHTAAASNLGQMLVKLYADEGVPLVNVVRRAEQVDLLRGLGAEYVVNSSDDDFLDQLTDAVAETDATLAFDATGGGRLADQILTAMERAQQRKGGATGNYGTAVHKQVYLYGSLDRSRTELRRTYGMAWGVGGWVLPNHLAKVGLERLASHQERVAAELTTTFASSYSKAVSLSDLLTVDVIQECARMATGEKLLVDPTRG